MTLNGIGFSFLCFFQGVAICSVAKFAGKSRKKRKRNVAAWDDISDEGDSEADSDESEWIMHEPSAAELFSAKAEKVMKAKMGRKAKKPSGGMDAFASADDYQQQIEADLAAMTAEVEDKTQPTKLPHNKVGAKRKQKQRRLL